MAGPDLTNVPCLYWLWHCVIIFWSRQEECMEYMAELWWCHHSLLRLSCHTRYSAIEDWMEVLERFVVLLYDAGISQSGTQTAVHPERLSYRWTSPHTSSTNTAHKEGYLPSWSLLGTEPSQLPSPPSPHRLLTSAMVICSDHCCLLEMPRMILTHPWWKVFSFLACFLRRIQHSAP